MSPTENQAANGSTANLGPASAHDLHHLEARVARSVGHRALRLWYWCHSKSLLLGELFDEELFRTVKGDGPPHSSNAINNIDDPLLEIMAALVSRMGFKPQSLPT